MRAIDTNIVVRFLTNDDEAQAGKARGIVAAGDVFVATSVLLESAWVLRSGYGFAQDSVVAALRGFAGLPGVTLEAPQLAARALDWAEQGIDFADALHLGRATACTAFLTFDRKFARAAAGMSDVNVELL